MKSRLNSVPTHLCIAALALAFALGACDTHTPIVPGLSSFQVVATDKSNAIDKFPTTAVSVHLVVTAIDKSGNVDTGYDGTAAIYSTPGTILTGTGADGQFSVVSSGPLTYPTVSFSQGQATVDVWASQVFGETVYWVEDRSGLDAGGGTELLATGISNPIRYAYPLLQDTQITSDNTASPLEGDNVVFDESKPRCLNAPGDGGACDPSQLYSMDMIVSSVGSDHFTVLDLNAYNPDSGMPNAGLDPTSGRNDLPGSWASMYVYTYSEPVLYVGDRITLLEGTLSEFDGDTQLDFPTYILNPDSRYSLPEPEDLPPPVPVNPNWCPPRDSYDQPSDYVLCETSTSALQLESLESALVSLTNATIPNRWIDCDLTGTGNIPYRNANGCMPETGGNFCLNDGGCTGGQDCVANECLSTCASAADCSQTDSEACIDGFCQNPCMCRQYCDSIDGCSELYDFNTYGQYSVTFPGVDGGVWKFDVISKDGVAAFNPYTSPGMVVDFSNGVLEQVRASDPMWLIAPRDAQDMCCHSESPGCTADAGLAVCPHATSE